MGKSIRLDRTIKLGRNVTIGDYASVAENSIISNNAVVGSRAVVSRVELGENSVIECEVICTGHGKGKIKIGKQSYIGIRNILDWSDDLTIGDYVHIAGSSTCVWTHASYLQALRGDNLNDKSNRNTAPVILENNVYIGGNCTIYPGVRIGHHSVVLPNSVVNHDVEPYTMMGGVPAQFIKKLVLKG